jgi:succinate dehydrogenase/fumarate reductase flavoprotein subunit
MNEMTGETLAIQAKSVVLCTGGDANLYRFNLNPACTTGDGYAMGYRAGAEMMNMEFKQMTLGMDYPTKNMVFDWVFQPHAKFTNGNGDAFLEDYIPQDVTLEQVFKARALSNMFSTRVPVSTYFDIALVSEVKAGRGTQRDCVYLDLRDPRVNLGPIERLEWWAYRGVDWRKDVVEVAFSHHCSNGGFRIDEHGQTTLPNLYAVGECAAGPHGADRSGGHMLAACQVFGKRAGRKAAERAASDTHPELDPRKIAEAEGAIRRFGVGRGDVKPSEVKAELQKKAWEDLLLIRSQEGLESMLAHIEQTRSEMLPKLAVGTPAEIVEAHELQNLLDVAELVSSVCLKRTESRGSHYRVDYPERDDHAWQRCITAKQTDGGMVLDTFVIDPEWEFRSGDMGDTHWG